MKDFMGNEIRIGDSVAYLMHTKTSSFLESGIVNRILNYVVEIETEHKKLCKKNPDKIIVTSRNPRGINTLIDSIKYEYSLGKKPFIYVSREYALLLLDKATNPLLSISKYSLEQWIGNGDYIGSLSGSPVFIDDELKCDFVVLGVQNNKGKEV